MPLGPGTSKQENHDLRLRPGTCCLNGPPELLVGSAVMSPSVSVVPRLTRLWMEDEKARMKVG